MARSKQRSVKTEQVRAYVEGVAKNLIDKFYGPDGPPWGTTLTDSEELLLEVREVLTEQMLDLSLALAYLENHQDKMKYDACRKAGLPITTSLMESAVKQINQRVKGSEKFWTEEGSEAVLQLRADQ